MTNITGTVTNVSLQQVIKLSFTADTALASTLWKANEITGTFGVTFGQQFTNSAAMFFLTNPPPNYQFYFITTQ